MIDIVQLQTYEFELLMEQIYQGNSINHALCTTGNMVVG